MSRPVYTALYSLMIIGLYFTLSVVYQSCTNKSKDATSTQDIADKVEEVADSYTEDSFFEDDDSDDVTSEVTGEFDTAEESTARTETEAEDFSAPSNVASTGGADAFLVVAGNYLLENNANQMVKKLRAQGYNDAEKVVFDLSQYYTVVAGSYGSRTIAKSISSELNGKGVDNYILKRKR